MQTIAGSGKVTSMVYGLRKVELTGLDYIMVVLLDGVRVVAIWSCAFWQANAPTNQFAHSINPAGLEWVDRRLLSQAKRGSSEKDKCSHEGGENAKSSKSHAYLYSRKHDSP
jgi:hypothetical protein